VISKTSAAIVNGVAYGYDVESATIPALGICLHDNGHKVELISMGTVAERYRAEEVALHESIFEAGEGRHHCGAVIIAGHCIACTAPPPTASGKH